MNYKLFVLLLARLAFNIHTVSSKSMYLSFLWFIPFTQNVFYLSGSEVSLNIMVLMVGFHSCLFAGLSGQPAHHMELLDLQLCRPQSKFNLCSPLKTAPLHLIMSRCLWETVQELLSRVKQPYCFLFSLH